MYTLFLTAPTVTTKRHSIKNTCPRYRTKLSRPITLCTASTPDRSADAQSALKPEHAQLQFYNTMSRKKQLFSTVEQGVVRFYSCGPTVYDYAHIGNFRAMLTYDVIKRWLMYLGYEVRHVLNITDIDDKIITRMQELGCSMSELTEKFADAFFSDLALLNVIPATHYPRATDYIAEIESLVTSLIDKGHAYQLDGSTYFSVPSFPAYGQLLDLTERDDVPRDADEHAKRDPRDFALWKAWKPEDGEVKWDSPLGPGRPGWHIECSSMAMKLLGPELDIHGGGIDLAFPHHENETAQCEACSGKQYVQFWVHNGFVNVNNEKMSKSLGNFHTLRDIVNKRIDARAFRYLVVSSQYRSALAFTDTCLDAARSAVRRIDSLRDRLSGASGSDAGLDEIKMMVQKARRDFIAGMNDDLNTPRAAAAMFSLVNAAEKMLKRNELGEKGAQEAIKCLDEFDLVFGINYEPDVVEEQVPTTIPAEIEAMLQERNDAREMKDYQLADSLRDRISSAGYAIVDTPQGAVLERKA